MNTLSTRPLSQSHRLLLRLSFSTAASPPSPFHRRSDEESRAVRVSVWWDFENCSLPSGVNVFKVAHSITSAVRVSGIKGPVQITAFGDILQLARPKQEALSATGITLTHVPSGGKNSADRSLLVDLMYWVSHNPPPAHLFLISGDRDFAGILHRLRMSNYNILLACPDDRAPSVLCSSSSIMWHWNALIKGECFTCKHFNQPPDGPYNSWYGHYNGILEDPYADAKPKLPARSQTDDTSDSEAVSGQRLQPAPRDVLRKISRIVNSHPKGIVLTSLRRQMLSGEVSMDKKFYGHKSFSQFLLSKPNLVKIKQSNGQSLVFPASRQASEPVESSADGEILDSSVTTKLKVEPNSQDIEPVQCIANVEILDSSVTTKQKAEPNSQDTEPVESISESENHNLAASSVSKAHANSVTRTLNEKLPLSSYLSVDGMQKKSDTISDKQEIYAQGKEGSKPSSGNQASEDEMGYFRKMGIAWFKKNDLGSEEKTDRTSVKVQALAPEPSILVESHGTQDSSQSSDDRVTMDAKVDTTTVDHGGESQRSPGFFTKLLGWFKLLRNDIDGVISNESMEKSKQAEESKRDELFFMDSFWSGVESFLNTYKGSKLIWNSKTREEIAHNLRKEGPLVIQPLAENDLLHLIDLLISEKKWIKELPLTSRPFRVVRPSIGKAESAQSINSGQLRSIILSSSTQPVKLPEKDEGKIPFDTTTKPCLKTKDEVLADCKKLLDDMFKESPEAINIGFFKNKFVEKYGYVVNYRKLGYPKFISLLQTIPDLKVGLNFVHRTVSKEPTPDNVAKKANSGVGKSNDEENSSPRKKLVPVDGGKEVNLRCKRAEDEYESPLSEDDMSDSEEEESNKRADKELPLTSRPFRAVTPTIGKAESAQINNSGRLRSIILSSPSQPEKLREQQDMGKIPFDMTTKPSCWKTKDQVLADCKKILEDMSDSEEEESKNRVDKEESSLLQEKSDNVGNNSKRAALYKTVDFDSKQKPGKSYSFVVKDDDDGNKNRLIDGILTNLKKSGNQKIPT